MKKIISVIILSTMLLTGCGVDMTGATYENHIYVDKETGVNYIWINSSTGVAISPRYNADGSLYVSKEQTHE